MWSRGLSLGSLARVDRIGDTVLWPGRYEVELDVNGPGRVRFELVWESVVLDLWPQQKV